MKYKNWKSRKIPISSQRKKQLEKNRSLRIAILVLAEQRRQMTSEQKHDLLNRIMKNTSSEVK